MSIDTRTSGLAAAILKNRLPVTFDSPEHEVNVGHATDIRWTHRRTRAQHRTQSRTVRRTVPRTVQLTVRRTVRRYVRLILSDGHATDI